jgi:hypothetical protein
VILDWHSEVETLPPRADELAKALERASGISNYYTILTFSKVLSYAQVLDHIVATAEKIVAGFEEYMKLSNDNEELRWSAPVLFNIFPHYVEASYLLGSNAARLGQYQNAARYYKTSITVSKLNELLKLDDGTSSKDRLQPEHRFSFFMSCAHLGNMMRKYLNSWPANHDSLLLVLEEAVKLMDDPAYQPEHGSPLAPGDDTVIKVLYTLCDAYLLNKCANKSKTACERGYQIAVRARKTKTDGSLAQWCEVCIRCCMVYFSFGRRVEALFILNKMSVAVSANSASIRDGNILNYIREAERLSQMLVFRIKNESDLCCKGKLLCDHLCGNCYNYTGGRDNLRYSHCSGCEYVSYCGIEVRYPLKTAMLTNNIVMLNLYNKCQKKDWPFHKLFCKELKGYKSQYW